MGTTITQIEINGKGPILDQAGQITNPLNGNKPLTVGELFKRSEQARLYAKNLIACAENMENLAFKGLKD